LATAEESVRVVVLGDSLAAGDGLAASEAFPAVLERELLGRGLPVVVQNSGVSGDTSAGGLQRLDWLLRQAPDLVVLELGANDGLRGLPPSDTEANLRAIIERSRAAGAGVLLVGMQVPGNMGTEHQHLFRQVFPRVAQDTGVPLVPFLLEGVALVPELNLPDGIHPTAEGHRRLAANVLPHLEPLVRERLAAPAAKLAP
jgi:acyl-CoA thioesterase-1